jgi:flagellar protein FlaG
MTQPVATNAMPDQTGGPQAAAPVQATPAPSRSDSASSQSQTDLRLVIEEDQTSGAFVYKTIDRRTGEVVQQLPRDALLRLKDDLEYLPGMVLNARS